VHASKNIQIKCFCHETIIIIIIIIMIHYIPQRQPHHCSTLFVNVLLESSDMKKGKREMKSLYENPRALEKWQLTLTVFYFNSIDYDSVSKFNWQKHTHIFVASCNLVLSSVSNDKCPNLRQRNQTRNCHKITSFWTEERR